MKLPDTSALGDKLNDLVTKVQEDRQTAVAAGAAVVLGGALVWRVCSSNGAAYKKKPTVFPDT